MFEFHTNKSHYFEMQRRISQEYVLPLLQKHIKKDAPWRVLEVGCAEAGVLKAFVDEGHYGVGIELSPSRSELARSFLKDHIDAGRASILNHDIYEVDPKDLASEGFDAIILKDVIEHIPHQERMVPRLAEFLAPGGKIFFGFPPWMMPFGGHQQIGRTHMVSKFPWVHLLPPPLYRGWVKLAGEPKVVRDELENVRSTQITIERFERIVRDNKLEISEQILWMFNPIYALKFGIAARKQFKLFGAIPFVRNFVSTAAYYVIGDPRQLSPKPQTPLHAAVAE